MTRDFLAGALVLLLASGWAWGDDAAPKSKISKLTGDLGGENAVPEAPGRPVEPVEAKDPSESELKAALEALVLPMMERFDAERSRKSPRGRIPSDYAYADSRYIALPQPARDDLPRPGKNMPHFNFSPLLEWYGAYVRRFHLQDFLQKTLESLWWASRRFGSSLDWSRARFAYAEVLSGSNDCETHGGRESQVIICSMPTGDARDTPPGIKLAHELVHVHQYQRGEHSMLGVIFGEHIPHALGGRDPYDYGGSSGLAERIRDPKRSTFERLGAEEGAEIVTDYLRLKADRGKPSYLETAQFIDPRIRSEAEAEAEIFYKRLRHYAAEVLPEAKDEENSEASKAAHDSPQAKNPRHEP